MHIENPIESLHSSLAHAVYVGFPEFEYQTRDWKHFHETKEDRLMTVSRRHTTHDITVYAMFPQTWSNTALGFGGIAGQAVTPAYTIVLESSLTNDDYCVYFAGRFAYHVQHPKDQFFLDIKKGQMASVKDFSDRYASN